MESEFRLFPDQASTMAGDVDALYFFLLGVSAFFIVLIAGAILFFALRYRRTHAAEYPRPIVGIVKLEIVWSVIPLLLTLVMFFWGARLFLGGQTPPANAMDVYVVGKQWMWKIEHPSGRKEINQLHVPVGRPIRLTMISEDVIHSFYVPAFRVKQDVLPGRYTSLWFEASKAGRYHLFCAEYCGTKHSEMRGTVAALTPADYQRWLAGKFTTEPLASRGASVFQRKGCLGCHGGGAGPRRGPNLEGRWGQQVELASGQTVAFDADYVRQSVEQPREHISAGFPPIMPAYQVPEQITEAEILAIVDYLKSSR